MSDDVKALEEALDAFKAAMLAKFALRSEKHGDRSVVIAGNKHLRDEGVYEGLYEHLGDEIEELWATNQDTPEQMDEAVDVANMAFLIWWRGRTQ